MHEAQGPCVRKRYQCEPQHHYVRHVPDAQARTFFFCTGRFFFFFYSSSHGLAAWRVLRYCYNSCTDSLGVKHGASAEKMTGDRRFAEVSPSANPTSQSPDRCSPTTMQQLLCVTQRVNVFSGGPRKKIIPSFAYSTATTSILLLLASVLPH